MISLLACAISLELGTPPCKLERGDVVVVECLERGEVAADVRIVLAKEEEGGNGASL